MKPTIYLFILLLYPISAFSDTIILKDETKIENVKTKLKEKKVEVRFSNGKEIKFRNNEIKSIDTKDVSWIPKVKIKYKKYGFSASTGMGYAYYTEKKEYSNNSTPIIIPGAGFIFSAIGPKENEKHEIKMETVNLEFTYNLLSFFSLQSNLNISRFHFDEKLNTNYEKSLFYLDLQTMQTTQANSGSSSSSSSYRTLNIFSIYYALLIKNPQFYEKFILDIPTLDFGYSLNAFPRRIFSPYWKFGIGFGLTSDGGVYKATTAFGISLKLGNISLFSQIQGDYYYMKLVQLGNPKDNNYFHMHDGLLRIGAKMNL